jgi:hypothetical protein
VRNYAKEMLELWQENSWFLYHGTAHTHTQSDYHVPSTAHAKIKKKKVF